MAELAAIGTVGSIAAMGAKLAVALYGFSTTVAGARKEVTAVAESISVFCTVLKLLGSTLEKQESARFSVSALSTVYDILGSCRKQFDGILVIVNKLKRESKGEVNVDVMARVKWVFKRGEVMKMQRDLNDMKLTLGIMLQALEYSKKSVDMKCSEADRAIELEETRCVAESLIAAQRANEKETELLEDEGDGEGSFVSPKVEEQSWRVSTYIADLNTIPDPRKQFENLVHMWAESGVSPSPDADQDGFDGKPRRRNAGRFATAAVQAPAKMSNDQISGRERARAGRLPDSAEISVELEARARTMRAERQADASTRKERVKAERQAEEGNRPKGDYWIPQATPEGRLFYFNTETGEQTGDLPLELSGSESDPDRIKEAFASVARKLMPSKKEIKVTVFDSRPEDLKRTDSEPNNWEWEGLRRRKYSDDNPRPTLPPLGMSPFPDSAEDSEADFSSIMDNYVKPRSNQPEFSWQQTSEVSETPTVQNPTQQRRQFSFQNMFRKNQLSPEQSGQDPVSELSSPNISNVTTGPVSASRGDTEFERLGLVKGDSTAKQESETPANIKIKIHFDDDLIVVRVPANIRYLALEQKIRHRLQIPDVDEINVWYKDEASGEMRDLVNDYDLDFAVLRNARLNLHVEVLKLLGLDN